MLEKKEKKTSSKAPGCLDNVAFFFRIDLCQFPTSPFRVEYLLLKKDELGFTACTVVTSTLEFNASSNKIEPPYRRCVCYTGKFSALSNKNCLVS